MARIPDEQIKRLKQEVSLQRLAESIGIVLTHVQSFSAQYPLKHQFLLA
jgi:hypothetical protein